MALGFGFHKNHENPSVLNDTHEVSDGVVTSCGTTSTSRLHQLVASWTWHL